MRIIGKHNNISVLCYYASHTLMELVQHGNMVVGIADIKLTCFQNVFYRFSSTKYCYLWINLIIITEFCKYIFSKRQKFAIHKYFVFCMWFRITDYIPWKILLYTLPNIKISLKGTKWKISKHIYSYSLRGLHQKSLWSETG